MKRSSVSSIYFLFVFFAITPSLFGFGRSEEAPAAALVSPDYTLLITAFDVSGLPLARQLMGETVMRNLANSLENISFRLRGEDEIAHHRDYAWEQARATAARALQTRRNERDLLLFRGEPTWRYRRNLRTIDEAIVELERQLAEIDAQVPVVEERPVFRLSERNRDGAFPQPPSPGEELRFTIEQRIDAFLVGSLSEFHGRVYLEARIFTRHSRSFSYEYSILFSSMDLIMAMDEIASSLVLAVSGAHPAAVIVHASPPDATILIDGTFVGRGDMEMHTLFPGQVEVEVRAENHVPAVFPMVLNPGELAEVFIDLTPLSLSAFEVVVPGHPGSLVYQGGLFVGETPLLFEMPMSQFAYLTVETPEGEIGTVIYRNNDIIRGNAQFARNAVGPGVGRMTVINTSVPISPEEGRVERARRNFYRAYGALWIILPATLLTAGLAANYINANNHVAMTGAFQDDPARQRRIYESARRAHNIRTGAFSIMGVTLGVTFFQIFRYLRAASVDATPLVPVPPAVPYYYYNYNDEELEEEEL